MTQIGRSLSARVAEKERRKNPVGSIQEALRKLDGLDQMRAAIEEDRAVIDQMRAAVMEDRAAIENLHATQGDLLSGHAAIPYMIKDIRGLIYENVKGRAVSLKMMKAISEGPKFLISGASRTFSMDQLLAMTEEFSVEYDFVYAFIVLAETYYSPEEEPEVSPAEDAAPEPQDLTEGA